MSNPDEDEMPQPHENGAARKKKPLACRRCRQRKQKCTEVRPCENCTQSGSECIPSESAAARPGLAGLGGLGVDYVQRLEERVAQLETLIPQESVDHINAVYGTVRTTRPEVSVHVSSHQPPPLQPAAHSPPDAAAAYLQPSRSPPDAAAAYLQPFRSPPDAATAYPATYAPLPPLPLPPPQPLPPHTVTGLDSPASPDDHDPPLDLLRHGLFSVVRAVTAPLSPGAYPPNRHPQDTVPGITPDLERFLVCTYFDMAQSQYPVLLRHEFLQWAEAWSRGATVDGPAAPPRWMGFFVYMVYAIAFLMTKSRVNGATRSRDFYALAARYLPAVLDAPDAVLRAQALLLLTLYALHTPSREQILALASRAIRFCVEAQLHRADADAEAAAAASPAQRQLRRRVFWCAYAMDRVVCSCYDLPASVADRHITVPLFADVDDDQLVAAAAGAGGTLVPSPTPTPVSSALHVIEGRQIESAIQEGLLAGDGEGPAAAAWRAALLGRLKAWNARSRAAAAPSQQGYASLRWHKMIYYYALVMLYRPTVGAACAGGPPSTVVGDPGDPDITVQAGCQALLLFRRFQMARAIAQPWLGLLSQFQIGVAVLFCFFAVPPVRWPAAFRASDAPDAVRACSSTLAVLAERWAAAESLRDVFEVLAREVPLASWEGDSRRMRPAARAAIDTAWPRLAAVVTDRPTLGMIRAMAEEPFGAISAAAAVPPTTTPTAMTAPPATTTTAMTAHPSPPSLFDGMDLQWAHLAQASSLDMDARYYAANDSELFGDGDGDHLMG